VKYCPFGAIVYDEGVPSFNDNCVLCGACVKPCPVDAISITRKVHKKDLSGYKGVFAYIETDNKDVKAVGLEMLSAARGLADKVKQECSAVVIGANGERVEKILSEYGADKIYVVENEAFLSYNTEAYTHIMVGILSKYKPSIVLFGATHLGRDLAPRVAGRIGTGLTADCTGLEIDQDGNLLQTRPTFGGNIMATIKTAFHRPQMATVRPNVIKKTMYRRDEDRVSRVEKIEAEIDLSRQKVKLLDEIKEVSPFSNVEEADYIVSGGKGLGTAQNFNLLKDLVDVFADAVGGSRVALGASRSAVDAGWVPHQHQVGQTGKTVTPKLYIACGISGQIQHMMGMRESGKIIAINRDRNAPIFRMADLCIIGDLVKVVPKLTKYLNKNKMNLKNGNIDIISG
jgi:electron transfer flavoprotein alpha subunit